MTVLSIGLVLFIGIHFIPTFTGLRTRLRASLGEGRYKGLYSLAAAVGLGLTIWGYGLARYDQPLLWNPPEWGPHLTVFLMFFSIVLLSAADISGKIKEIVRHPMITGVGIWGFAHLISNGGLADLMLFGGFLAWAILARLSMRTREAAGTITVKSGPIRNDLLAIAVGTAVYVAFIWFGHELITGLPAVSF